jgi:hypothetical protein
MPNLICDMQALATAIAATLPAASKEKDRFDIGGVSVHATGTDIVLTATDERVTARYRIELPAQADADFRVLIPRQRAAQLLAIIGDATGECQVVRDETLFSATFEQVGSFRFVIQGTEVPFPLAAVDAQWPAGLPVSNRDLDLDPALASRVKKAFAAAGADGALRFELYGEGQPIVVRHEAAPWLEALILPHAAEEGDDGQAPLFGSDATGDGGSGETREDRDAAIDDPATATQRAIDNLNKIPAAFARAHAPSGESADETFAREAREAVEKHDIKALDNATDKLIAAKLRPGAKRTPIRPNKPRAKKPAKKGKR